MRAVDSVWCIGCPAHRSDEGRSCSQMLLNQGHLNAILLGQDLFDIQRTAATQNTAEPKERNDHAHTNTHFAHHV